MILHVLVHAQRCSDSESEYSFSTPPGPTSGKAQITYGSYLSENCLDTVWYLVSVLKDLTLSDSCFL
jgi:hypothetical protein